MAPDRIPIKIRIFTDLITGSKIGQYNHEKIQMYSYTKHTIYIYTIKPVLRGHLWDKGKVVYYDR